jgi:hypothetical protein
VGADGRLFWWEGLGIAISGRNRELTGTRGDQVQLANCLSPYSLTVPIWMGGRVA